MKNHTIVALKKGEGRTIKSGGSWIFDNEIDTITGTFSNGAVVRVHDFDGYPMGYGMINQNSKIRIRMLTRKEEAIDGEFWEKRIRFAWEYRKTVMYGGNDGMAAELAVPGIGHTGRKDLNCCRVIFGEADGFPGFVVDKYNDVLVVECLALGMESFKEQILQLLVQILQEDGITIRGIFERSDASVRKKEGLLRRRVFSALPLIQMWRYWKTAFVILWM